MEESTEADGKGWSASAGASRSRTRNNNNIRREECLNPSPGIEPSGKRSRIKTSRFESESNDEQRMIQQAIRNSKTEFKRSDFTNLSIPDAPIYYPTVEEFKNPFKYIDSIRHEAERFGIAKIVPPAEWNPPCQINMNNTEKFSTKLQQINTLQEGQGFDTGADYDIAGYKNMADNFLKEWTEKYYGNSAPLDDLARDYWEAVETGIKRPLVQYGSDLDTLLYCSGFSKKMCDTTGIEGLDYKKGGDKVFVATAVDTTGGIIASQNVDEDDGKSTNGTVEEGCAGAIGVTDIGLDIVGTNLESDTKVICDIKSDIKIEIEGNNNREGDSKSEINMMTENRSNDDSIESARVESGLPNDTNNDENKLDIDLKVDVEVSSSHGSDAISNLNSSPNNKSIPNPSASPNIDIGFINRSSELNGNSDVNGNASNDVDINTNTNDHGNININDNIKTNINTNSNADRNRTTNNNDDISMINESADEKESEKDGMFSQAYYERTGWNLNNISSCEGSVLKYLQTPITGVNVPWLYIGMLFSSFCWHNEDNYLYSINYSHLGATKQWYGVPGSEAKNFEKISKNFLMELFRENPDQLHHMTTQISPSLLQKHGIPIYQVKHEPKTFLVTFPKAFHAGFSYGFNVGEAVNFGTYNWLAAGGEAEERYRQFARNSVFSHQRLLFILFNHRDDVDPEFHTRLAKEVLGILDEEIFSRPVIFKQGVRDISSTVKLPPNTFESIDLVAAEYDDMRCCHVCKHICLFSAIACECDRSKVACIRHVNVLCKCAHSKKYMLEWATTKDLKVLRAQILATAKG
jgi:hypothetical protein